MKNFDFDICAIPILLLILYLYYSRRIARYSEYRMFFIMGLLSLVCVGLDIAMEFVVNPVPLGSGQVALGMFISFSYKLLHNMCMVLYLLFIMGFTRTDYQFKSPVRMALIWAPYAVLAFLLVQNFFTGNLFTVTAENGYARGPLFIVLYFIAAIYDVAGLAYCLYCRRFLDGTQWVALTSVYVLLTVAVVLQLLVPGVLLEMFSTAVGMLMVAFMVLRPEDGMDAEVGARTFKSFQTDLHNTLLTKRKVSLITFRMRNANENRNHMGDKRYADYVASAVDAIHSCVVASGKDAQVYYEQPESIYLMVGEIVADPDGLVFDCVDAVKSELDSRDRNGAWFDPDMLIVNLPDDLDDADTIIYFCHRFCDLVGIGRGLMRASDIVGTRDFEVLTHIEDVLERAVNEDGLEMYYQPIYSIKSGRFMSAEALARVNDSVYGMVSPAVFIPAAERSRMILILGYAIIDSVFGFIEDNDMDELGLSYIEINLSVEQCLLPNLSEMVAQLQEKHGISPSHVNFEITESAMGLFSDVARRNLAALYEMGYRFSLDDYGVGYSNIRRVRELPFDLIKVDKSLVDDMFTDSGRVIMRNTVEMMQGLDKQLVIEGVETGESLTALKEMSCDYIQGFYFSRPLPEREFVAFAKAQAAARRQGTKGELPWK